MSKNVIISGDSTCDLSPELIERYELKLVSLTVNLGEAQYLDGVDINPEMIYRHYEKTGGLPKTSSPNIATFADFFERNAANGSEMVFFTVSSEMSSTYNNARIAAAKFENVYVVDTRNLSSGGGLLIVAAAEMAEKGMAAREIADACRALADKVDASFVVDDLEFLHKGGRCSAVAAFGANLLRLKPCIVVKNGKMGVSKKYRGKFLSVLQTYIADRIGDGSNVDPERVFITHAGCDEEICKQCVKQLQALSIFKEIHVTRAGCTISSHCGRNTLGVLFIRK